MCYWNTNDTGFSPIVAIFYTVFHPTEGTKVLHQVPIGSITPDDSSAALDEPLFDFDLVKNYIIPKAPLCDRLVGLKVGQYRIIGYPVSITAQHYARNSFSFNFCFVFDYNDDAIPYEPNIRRLGRMFKNLEEQYQILSRKEQDNVYFDKINLSNDNEEVENKTNTNQSIGLEAKETDNNVQLHSIHDLIQQIFQDLNNYSECLIPIDSGNSVDIKLFPVLPPPARIYPEDVPISTVNLKSLIDVNWDPTMLKILPYINGINSVKRISLLTDADYWVVKSCIQHLMHYKCIIITDIFQFTNIYAPTSDIDLFLIDNHMASECQAYIVTSDTFSDLNYEPDTRPEYLRKRSDNSRKKENSNSVSSSVPGSSTNIKKKSVILPSKSKLFYLYRSLHQGQNLKQWYKDHQDDLKYIDVRRFITFGCLRGIIYRIQSIPIIDSIIQKDDHHYLSDLFTKKFNVNDRPSNRAINKNLTDLERIQIDKIVELLEEVKSFDSICTELNIDRKTMDTLLRKIGQYNTVNY